MHRHKEKEKLEAGERVVKKNTDNSDENSGNESDTKKVVHPSNYNSDDDAKLPATVTLMEKAEPVSKVVLNDAVTPPDESISKEKKQ